MNKFLKKSEETRSVFSKQTQLPNTLKRSETRRTTIFQEIKKIGTMTWKELGIPETKYVYAQIFVLRGTIQIQVKEEMRTIQK